MLFSNFLCLFYLMVLIRCHTISKSIVSYDQVDDVIDSLNDYPFTTFLERRERLHPKYRRDEQVKTTHLIAKTHEATAKSKEKTSTAISTRATKRKKSTKAQTTKTTEALKPLPTAIDNTKLSETVAPPINLFRRLQQKFGWRNKTAVKSTKKKRKFKFHNKHKDTSGKDKEDKVDRDRRDAESTPSFDFMDQNQKLFSFFKTTPQLFSFNYSSDLNLNTDTTLNSDTTSTDSVEGVEDTMNNYNEHKFSAIEISPSGNPDNADTTYTSPTNHQHTSPTDKLLQELQDDLENFRGTDGIEKLLNNIKMHAINVISEQSDSVGEVIANSVTETTYDVTPMLHGMGNPGSFDFKSVVELVESDKENNRRPVAPISKEHVQAKPNDAIPNYNLEYKLQREMKYALMRAKDTLQGQLNKARDQVKSVTWKIMHHTAGELNDIANKIEGPGAKEVPATEHLAKINSPQTQLSTPPTLIHKTPTITTKSSKRIQSPEKQKDNSKDPHPATTSTLATQNRVQPTTRQNRGTSKLETGTEEIDALEQDDYAMLNTYEKILARKESAMRMLTTSAPPNAMLKYFNKLSKRDTETLENLNLKENIRKLADGEGMPDASNLETNYESTTSPRVEISNDGSTSRMTETTLRELTNPDNSFVGLTNKIHYNEFINGYKHYLNFARDLSKFDHNYSNLVRYQAHRHHSVEDIGKFILTRLPPIPEWKLPAELDDKDQRRDKRYIFEEIDMDNQDKTKTTTTKGSVSWFKRHFNIFHDTGTKKKFHTSQTVNLKSDRNTFVTRQDNVSTTARGLRTGVNDRVPGEKEGLIFRWKPDNPFKDLGHTTPTTTSLNWESEVADMDSEPVTTPDSEPATTPENRLDEMLKKFDKNAESSSQSDMNLNELLKSLSTVSRVVDLESQAKLNLNELIKKISKDTARITISKALNTMVTTMPTQSTTSTLAEEGNSVSNYNLNSILALVPNTYAPSEGLYWNGLVSALILQNYTAGNYVKKSVLDSPRNVINKLLNSRSSHSRHSVFKEGASVQDEAPQELSRAKRNKNNRNVLLNEEFEHLIDPTLPTSLFDVSALHQSPDGKLDKFGYVDINLVAKPTTAAPRSTKKSKCKKVLGKLWVKKKKDKDKDKKPVGKVRKERHSPLQILKNLFKSGTTDADYNYETTEPYTFKLVKYADMERSLKEFMKQVPNISREEFTYKPATFDNIQSLSSINFPMTGTDAMNPIFAVATTPRPLTYNELSTSGFTDIPQLYKKNHHKIPVTVDSEPNVPFNLRVNSNPDYKTGAPPVHVTVTPVTVDELMKEVQVNVQKGKIKPYKIQPAARTYVTQSLTVDRPFVTARITSKTAPKITKMKHKQYLNNITPRERSKYYQGRNFSSRNVGNDIDLKKYVGPFQGLKYYKLYNKDIRDGNSVLDLVDKLHSEKTYLYDKDDNKDENELYSVKNFKYEKEKNDGLHSFAISKIGFDTNEKTNSDQFRGYKNFGKVEQYNRDEKSFYGYGKDEKKYSNQFHELNRFGYDKDEKSFDTKDKVDEITYEKDANKDRILLNSIKTFGTDGMGPTTPIIRLFTIKGILKDKDERSYSLQFPGIKSFVYDKYSSTTEGFKNENSDDFQFHGTNQYGTVDNTDFLQLHDANHFGTNFFDYKTRNDKSYENHPTLHPYHHLFENDEDATTESDRLYYFATARPTIKEYYGNKYHDRNIISQYNTRQFDVDNDGARLHNSAHVFRSSEKETTPTTSITTTKMDKPQTKMRTTTPYVSTKPYKSYPDYFNDFFNWNRDILSMERVTEPSIDSLMSSLMNITTADVHHLREEILHMQNYLKDLTTPMKGKTTTEKFHLATSNSADLVKNVKNAMPKKDSKAFKHRRNSYEDTKSLDEINQMVNNINNLYKHSFNKYTVPDKYKVPDKYTVPDNSKSSVLTTFTPFEDSSEVPILDTTIFAYDDTLNILTEELKDYTSPKSVSIRSKMEHKPFSTKTKVSPPPEQYFRTPVPMHSDDFDRFLKDHDLDIADITTPYNEISKFEEKWEKEQHAESKLMDTRGKHEKFFDVPKMLKGLPDVDFTPTRASIEPSVNANKLYTPTESHYNKLKVATKKENFVNPKNNVVYVYVDDFEYNGLNDRNQARRQTTNDNTGYDNVYSFKTKRNIKPLNFKKTTSMAKATTSPGNINFDITIIDIDDITSIRKLEHVPETSHSQKQPLSETTSPLTNETEPVTTRIIQSNATEYKSLDIDPEVPYDPNNIQISQDSADQEPVYNVTEHAEENVLNTDDLGDEDDFNYEESLKQLKQKEKSQQTYYDKTTKLKTIFTTDSIESELQHNPFDANVKRKLKMHKGKPQDLDKSPNLHNDLLYHSLDDDKFVGSSTEQTLVPSKRPGFYHQETRPLKMFTTVKKIESDNSDSTKTPNEFYTQYQTFPRTRTRIYKIKVAPLAFGAKNESMIDTGEDLFAPRVTTKLKPASIMNLQKNYQQPKRILFSSHTLKYDVLYDDFSTGTKTLHKGPVGLTTKNYKKQKKTKAPNRHVHMTKGSRKTPSIDGGDSGKDVDAVIDVNKIVREVLGDPKKEYRRRRKAMWRKWKTTSSLKTNGTTELKPQPSQPSTRRWFRFMPLLQKTSKTTTASTPSISNSSLLVLAAENSTSSPILLTTTATLPPQLSEDVKKREERSSDSMVYIVDVLNGNHHVKMSSVTAASDGNQPFPKVGDITFIYPAHVISEDGKCKINTSEKYFVEDDWATTLKPHLPRFKTYHPPETKKATVKDQKSKKNEKGKTKQLCPAINNTLLYFTESDSSPTSKNNILYDVSEKKDSRLISRSFFNIPMSIVTSPHLYDHSKIKNFQFNDPQDTSEYNEKTTIEKPIDASDPNVLMTTEIYDANKYAENPYLETSSLMFTHNAHYNEKIVKYATNCCFSGLPSLPTWKTTSATTIDLAKLKSEIAKIEEGIESHKLSLNSKAKSKIQSDLDDFLDKIVASEAGSSSVLKTPSITEHNSMKQNPDMESAAKKTTTVADEETTRVIAEAKEAALDYDIADAQKAAKAKAEAEAKAAAETQAAIEAKKAADARQEARERERAEAQIAADAKEAAEERKAAEAKQAAEEKLAAAKAKALAEKLAHTKKEGVYKSDSENLTTKTTTIRPTITYEGSSHAKTTPKQTITKHTKPATLTTSKIPKSKSKAPDKKKKQKNMKTTTTTTTSTTTKTSTTKKLATLLNPNKEKSQKPKLVKRATNEPPNTVYTAKDVAALEVIVDLMKEPGDGKTCKDKCGGQKCKQHNNFENRASTNAIQVHIALPYLSESDDRKRSAEQRTKLRKVFAAKMSNPVDIEYQVRSLDVETKCNSPCPGNSECISPGMYLLVEDTDNNKGFALKPVVRQIKTDFVTSTVKTTSPKNLAKVSLSKDYIQSINKQIFKLYQNLSSLEPTTKHTIKKRFDDGNRIRIRKRINWDEVKKIFFANKRVCNCKCSANQTMCRACTASDAVMTELLFEFENLAQYMNDHCTEIQTYFWMNPSGGRKLRDIVHQIDKNINDYYKRVKGKCHGRPCNAFDKREISLYTEDAETDDVYIGEPLINDIENLAQSLEEAQKLRLVCNKKFKDIVDKLVRTSRYCTTGIKTKRSVTKQKKVYSLDNINVNIFCNQNASVQTESTFPSTMYDVWTTEFPVIDYTDDEVKKTSRKSLKKIFAKRKNVHSNKKSPAPSKRETNVQIESPFMASNKNALWKEYMKDSAQFKVDNDVKPVITLDVLEKTDENTVTYNPHLKATLVKIIPGNYNNTNSKDEGLVRLSEIYPKRITKDDDLITTKDFITEPQSVNNDINFAESALLENNDLYGYIKSRFAKSTPELKLNDWKSSTKNDASKDDLKITSSVKTVTTDNATLTSETKPMYFNVTTTVTSATSPLSSSNTDWDDDSSLKDDFNIKDTLPTSQKTTKENWFNRLKHIITPGYSSTKKPNEPVDKVNNMQPQQELVNKLNVVMNAANMDVNSDITTTRYPTLFIIEDVANDETINPESYENLLVNIMEYEKDKIDNELRKHKKRQRNSLNVEDDVNDMLLLDRDRDRVTKLISNSKLLPEKETEAAEGDYCIYNSWKKIKTALSSDTFPIPTTTTPATTTTLKEEKTLIKMLLQSMKRNSAKAGKRPINTMQPNTQREPVKPQLHTSESPQKMAPTQQKYTEIWRVPVGARHELMKNQQGPTAIQQEANEQALKPQEKFDKISQQVQKIRQRVQNQMQQAENRQREENQRQEMQNQQQQMQNQQQQAQNQQQADFQQQQQKIVNDNVDVFLAQFASTIIFTHPSYKHLTMTNIAPDKLTVWEEESTPYNDLPEINIATYGDSETDNVPYVPTTLASTTTTNKAAAERNNKGPVAINATVAVVPYFKKRPNFSLDVQYKKGKTTSNAITSQTLDPKSKLIKFKSATLKTPSSTSPSTGLTYSTTQETSTQSVMSKPFTHDNHYEVEVDNEEIYNEEKELDDVRKKGTKSKQKIANTYSDNSDMIHRLTNPSKTTTSKGKTGNDDKESQSTTESNNNISGEDSSSIYDELAGQHETKSNNINNKNSNETSVTYGEKESESHVTKPSETKSEIKGVKESEQTSTPTETINNKDTTTPTATRPTTAQSTTNKIATVDKYKETTTTTKPLKETKTSNPLKPKPEIQQNDKKVEEKNPETSFKKVLNNDISTRKLYKEACDPKTEACLCDIRATSEHVVDVRKMSPRKDFEQYATNITCYKYKKPPPYFFLEPWKRKTHRRKHPKQTRNNKYFDSVPLKKTLRWDWIRRKRSLLSNEDYNSDDDDDSDEFDENNYLGDALLRQENNKRKGNPKVNKTKKYNKDDDKNNDGDFESLYKGEDNIYRAVRKRLKRTAGDMKELVHGLRNLPPLRPRENELYAMLGDKVSLDCVHGARDYKKFHHPIFWDTERTDMLAPPNVIVNGPAVILKKVEARNSGNYTCSQGGKTRTIKLTVVTLPQYHVVFIPMYSSKHGCSYNDLKAMQYLGPFMSKESCMYTQNSNAIQIDEPICLEDKDDGSVHIRATAIVTACTHPAVRCSAQCRRDLQCAFALLCAANAPVLHSVKVVVSKQGRNKTLIPSYGSSRRMIVTHTLRKKELQKHSEYHQLAASMYPGNLDIVVSCPAGYYLIPKQKICAACPADTYAEAGENTCYACAPGTSSEPGAAHCRLSLRRMRRYDWWWYPPCGYALAALGVLCACVLCTACALLAHVTSRSTARAHAAAVSIARVDSRWTWSKRAAAKRCSSTSAGEATHGPPSPSAVILARFFRASASSSRATDSQETKFEQWKEKNIPPPLPPIDFDLS